MFIVGHTLLWHQQIPRWVFRNEKDQPLSREALLERMRHHIQTVVGRYKGRIAGWDVVNEALNDDGTLRRTQWLSIIGEDYLLKAFQFAHEADPKAELYYNDYALEKPAKRKGAVELLTKLRSQGARIAGVGLQGHYKLDTPTAAVVEETIQTFSKVGFKVMITELDVDVLPPASRPLSADVSERTALRPELNPYTNGLPDVVQKKLALRYGELFGVFQKHRQHVERVTFWGVTDKQSWLNYWPVRGRMNYPLLFDRNCQPKPALESVIRVTGEAKP
jgi:endo-1,4-beta-xylanase